MMNKKHNIIMFFWANAHDYTTVLHIPQSTRWAQTMRLCGRPSFPTHHPPPPLHEIMSSDPMDPKVGRKWRCGASWRDLEMVDGWRKIVPPSVLSFAAIGT